MKEVFTMVRKNCLPDREKSPYRVTVKSSYHAQSKVIKMFLLSTESLLVIVTEAAVPDS